ncbi:MAG: DoxX family protein [Pyrinomonadaceae bacterium]
MKTYRILYWIFTGLLCLLALGSAGMYIFNYPMVADIFTKLGYPTYIIYPLATAEILGVIAILTKKSKLLKDWAYAGFFYDFLLAASAHYFSGVPSPFLAIVGLVLLLGSYILDKKIYG